MDRRIIIHTGTPHEGYIPHSGRYPYGSGDRPHQHSVDFLTQVEMMKASGMAEEEIGKALHLKGARALRQEISVYKAKQKNDLIIRVQSMAKKGMSSAEIAKEVGTSKPTIEKYLKMKESKRLELYSSVADQLKDRLKDVDYIDVGEQVERYIGVTRNTLDSSLTLLKSEGYNVYRIPVNQLGSNNFQKTTISVLAPPGADYKTVAANMDKVKLINDMYSLDGGKTFERVDRTPVSISDKRVKVVYAEDGGAERDGLIFLRRGVDDLSLGKKRYAQVRIAVNDQYYVKGMAVYADDKEFPPGVDVIWNVSKHKTMPLMSDDPKVSTVFKRLETLPDGTVNMEKPFSANIDHINTYVDSNGKIKKTAINVINEEGDWNSWSKTISPQVLSKQDMGLIKAQLGETYNESRKEFEEIKSLTNPTLKKQLLADFADSCDSASVYLKAKGFKDQSQKVLLPVPSLKENECYCPTYDTGTTVFLIRYPHQGRFEIPKLVVNNKNREGSQVITKNAVDAIGVNAGTLKQLSGADTDGDTVTVIPLYSNSPSALIKAEKYRKELVDFDPHEDYAGYDGMKVIKKSYVGKAMGEVTNLLTDMDLACAPIEERIKVVKHTLVIIDAYKHKLDYKRSYKENGIAELKKKYQMDAEGHTGAGTLISRSKSRYDVDDRKAGYRIDKETGKKVYTETGKTYVSYYEVDGKKLKPKEYYALVKEDPSVKERAIEGPEVKRRMQSKKLAEVDDAYQLVSANRYPAEIAYADYSNKQKALANEARKELLTVKVNKKNPSTAQVYAKEVESLNRKIDQAAKHAPIERQAQILGNYIYKGWLNDNPQWSNEEKKKARGQALVRAREKMGTRQRIEITDDEWKAIQLGAFSSTQQQEIFKYANKDRLRDLATPKTTNALSSSDIARAKAMLARSDENAPTLKEVASVLGVSPSTLSKAIND